MKNPDYHRGRFEIDEILSLVRDNKVEEKRCELELDGKVYLVRRDKQILRTFKHKGTICVECGKKATHFKLTFSHNQPNMAPHLNLFDDEGTLFTQDHIFPRCCGGKDYLSNSQTMCTNCNNKKGCKFPKEIEAVISKFFIVDTI